MSYLMHQVSVFNLDLELLYSRTYTSRVNAEDFAKALRSNHSKHIGKISIETKEHDRGFN